MTPKEQCESCVKEFVETPSIATEGSRFQVAMISILDDIKTEIQSMNNLLKNIVSAVSSEPDGQEPTETATKPPPAPKTRKRKG